MDVRFHIGLSEDSEHPKQLRNVSKVTCDSATCSQAPLINELSRRVSDLIGVSPRNFESQEFVRYEPGQHYSWHPDEYTWRDAKLDVTQVNCGPRLLTFFLYMSDVEEGGETHFMGPRVKGAIDGATGFVVRPRKAKAILWANMKEDWRVADFEAVHRSLVVKRGVKWATTIWVHSSGFRIPELYAGRTCAGRGI